MYRDGESLAIYTYIFKPPKLTIPLITDDYMIHDVIFYVACQWLIHKGEKGYYYGHISESLYDYIEAVLDPLDLHLLDNIAEEVIRQAKRIVDREEFLFLKDERGVEDVYYRLEHAESHVKLYVARRQS